MKAGSGDGQVRVNGVLHSLPYSENFAGGVDVTVRAVPASGSSFDHWSWSIYTSTLNPITLPMPNQNTVIYAHFNISYLLTLTKAGTGSGQLVANGGIYSLPVVLNFDEGTSVTLEAAADDTSLFSNWDGDLSGSINPTSIVMDGNKSVQANFELCNRPPYLAQGGFSFSNKIDADNDHVYQYTKLRLDVTFSSFFCQKNRIRYHITWAPKGAIDAWGEQWFPESGYYEISPVENKVSILLSDQFFSTISALDSAHWVIMRTLSFLECPSCACSIWEDFAFESEYMDNPLWHALSLTKSGPGDGKVKVNSSIRVLPYSEQAHEGTPFHLAAIPTAGSVFSGWSGAVTSSEQAIDVIMDTDKDLTVTFNEQKISSVWKSQSAGTSVRLNWVKTVSDQIGWIAGNSGLILKTTNGGKVWNVASGNLPSVHYYCIDALDAQQAIVDSYVQDPISSLYMAGIYKTIDGGSTWVKKYEKSDVFINTVKMFDAMNGIALADPVQGKWLVLSTSDGGETWIPQSNAPAQKEGEFGNFGSCWHSSTKGWFGTDKPHMYALSGSSWSELPVALLDHVNALSFDESGNGLAGDANTGQLVRTKNWGQTWEQVNAPETSLSWISYFNQRFWLTVNKNLYSSPDLGNTWTLEATAPDNLRHMSFTTAASGLYGWAVGRSGTILYYVPQSVPVEEKNIEILPEGLVLQQNYPNPFNAETQIRYELPYSRYVKLVVYDLLGHELRELANENQIPGLHEVSFNAGQLPSGVYLYKLTVVEVDGKSYQLTKKLMLMK